MNTRISELFIYNLTMIYLFTDFGYNGPYVGLMKSVLALNADNIPVIDLMHDAPAYNPYASAILLSSLSTYLPEDSITVAVVDPGVGHSERRPIMIKADNRWFVGPDNGLFQHIVHNACSVDCYELRIKNQISKTFHGRDLFAPVAAQLATGKQPDAEEIDISELITVDNNSVICEIIYIDNYGNAMTGLSESAIRLNQKLRIDGCDIGYAETFSSVEKGEIFWYINSINLVEISVNSGSAEEAYDLSVGKKFEIS